MEHQAKQSGHISQTIFLDIHPSVLLFPGVKFSAGVSNKADVPIYEIGEAGDLIDYEVLYSRTNWSDPEIQARLQHAERCEILVPRWIPMSLIRNMPHG